MIMLMHNRQSFASCNDMIDIQELHLKQIKSINIEYFLESTRVRLTRSISDTSSTRAQAPYKALPKLYCV